MLRCGCVHGCLGKELPCTVALEYCKRGKFKRHFYPQVGELEDSGEEYQCAQQLDIMPEMGYWVRNIARKPEASFWLQTADDKFYPDFVAKLKDGRYLVVEYKNATDWSNDDSREKRMLGELWAARSEGSCLFIMPKGQDWAARTALVNKQWRRG